MRTLLALGLMACGGSATPATPAPAGVLTVPGAPEGYSTRMWLPAACTGGKGAELTGLAGRCWERRGRWWFVLPSGARGAGTCAAPGCSVQVEVGDPGVEPPAGFGARWTAVLGTAEADMRDGTAAVEVPRVPPGHIAEVEVRVRHGCTEVPESGGAGPFLRVSGTISEGGGACYVQRRNRPDPVDDRWVFLLEGSAGAGIQCHTSACASPPVTWVDSTARVPSGVQLTWIQAVGAPE